MNTRLIKIQKIAALFAGLLAFGVPALRAVDAGDDEPGRFALGRRAPAVKAGAVGLSPYAAIAYGTDSNVFQSPDSWTNPLVATQVVSGLEQSDTFLQTAVGIDARWRPTKADRLDAGFSYDKTSYSDFPVLDDSAWAVDAAWRHRFNRNWDLGVSAGYKSKDTKGSDIFGVELLQKYSYKELKFGPEATLRLRRAPDNAGLFGDTKFHLEVLRRTRDYEDPAPAAGQPLDFAKIEFAFSAAQELGQSGKHELELQAEYDLKDYDEYLAQTATGGDNLLGIKREQEETTVGLEWTFRPARGSRLAAGVERYMRVDPYLDYYSYDETRFTVKANHRFPTGTELGGRVRVRNRDYEKQSVIVPGPNPLLTKDYLDFQIEAMQPFLKHFEAGVAFSSETRDTNRLSTSSSGRDYTQRVLMFSLSTRW